MNPATATSESDRHGRPRPVAPVRMLAMHFTTPSSSEAKVLGAVLAYLADDIECTLWVNRKGGTDAGSAFDALGRPNVAVKVVDPGLPLEPAAPRSLASRLGYRAGYAARLPQLVLLARKLKPDVVYTSQQRFDCFVGELISRVLRIPHVVHLHYTPGPELRARTLKRLQSCEIVIAISSFIAGRAIGIGVRPERIVVLPNALGQLPPPVVRTGRGGSVVIGQVGRMVENKGFADSVSAFARVRRGQGTIELVLVGDGVDRGRVEALADRLGVADRVQFTGWRSDVASLLDRFDIFIHPSRDEPFGLAVLEASAAGLPVVAYDDGGLPEVVAAGETGLLAPVGDIDALAAFLEQLVDDEDLRTAMGAAGRERVRTVFRPDEAGQRFSAAVRKSVEPRVADGQGQAPLHGSS